jgi:hypothetical protein
VESLPEKFFKQESIFGSNEEHITFIKKYRAELKQSNEQIFYTGNSTKDIPNNEKLIEALKELRKHGLGILNSEIEDLSKDKQLLNTTNKLSLDKIFEISSLLTNGGKKISDIIDITQIDEFLKSVIELPTTN